MSDRKLPMDKSERILNELLKIPVNTICCDCGAANPKWASFSLGCFLCVRCCSVHRKMGTHISKVKSVSLDSWTQEDIDMMKNWGNGKVNAMYMPHPEKHPPPTSMEGSAMEQYIRSKYERKQFMEGGGGGGGNSNQASSRSAYGNTFSGGNGNSRSNNDIMTNQTYTTQMKALRAMGFTDNAKNLQVLQSTDGDVPNAIEILCRIGQGPVTASTPSRSTTNNSRAPARSSSNSNNTNSSTDPKEKILWNMGFHDSALNKEALRRAGGNPEVAAGILIDDKDKLAKAVRDKASGSPALPSRLDPPSSSRNNNNNNTNNQSDNLLLDLSTPDDNQQQLQQRQQQLLFQQQQMQMQGAFGNNNNNQQFGNNDQFGQNHTQLQSILDKNASILALYSNENQGMNNAFGLQQPQQQQLMGGNNMGDMNSWSMNNGVNNNNNNNMAMGSAFGLQQSSMATGNNNMFGNNNNNNNNMMGMGNGMGTMGGMGAMGGMGNTTQTNPFGGLTAVSQQSSSSFSTPTTMGFNTAFGVNNNNNGNNNQFAGLGTMGAGSPMTTNQSLFGTNSNNMFASGANGMSGAGMGTMGTMGTMGNNNAGMNGMNGFGANNNNNNNNNFNLAFGMNPNQGNNMNNGGQHNPWDNNNNNNNNQGNFF